MHAKAPLQEKDFAEVFFLFPDCIHRTFNKGEYERIFI